MKTKLHYFFTTLALFVGLHQAAAQTTAFTYQGRLNNGTNVANGSYDLHFAVYDANVAGNFIAGPLTNSAVIVSNGLFTVTLDFGAGVFTGTNYWVEMAVRPNGGANFATLVPRQQLTPAPYALSLVSPQVNALCPPGSVMAYMGTNVPPGWLPCNGANVSRTQYAALFAVIGTSSGLGDGSTTFNLPDLRGQFLRGMNNGGGADPDAGSRTSPPGFNPAITPGSRQPDAFQGHFHEMEYAFNDNPTPLARPLYGGSGTELYSANDPNLGKAYQATTDGTHGTPRVSSESRPVNVYVNYIIKY